MTEKRDESVLFLPGTLGKRALRARLVAGEASAYRECYQQYAPRLMRLLTGILRNKARAEELLQETFVAAFRSMVRFRGDVSLATWLARIATNRAYNAIRDDTRAKRLAPLHAGEETTELEPRFEGRDLARKVLDLLDQMDAAKRVALLLFAEGYTVSEIAEVSGEPRGTILARLSRGRAELSLRMAEAGLVSDGVAARMEDRT